MPSTLETVDKQTGALDATKVLNSEITKVLAQLGIYSQMLPAERAAERAADRAVVESARSHLCEIRNYIDDHFQWKPKADRLQGRGMAEAT